MIGFLEENICADAGFLQLSVVFHRSSGDVDVHSANRAVFMLNPVNGFNTFQYILNGVIDRIFTGFDREALMTHVLQRDDLAAHLILRQFLAGDVLVFVMIRTVNTAVNAIVGKVQRRKHNNTVSVKCLLDLLGKTVHFCHLFGNIASQQNRGFAMGKSGTVYAVFGFYRPRFFKQTVDQRNVSLVIFRIANGFEDFCVIYEFLRF